MLSAIDVENAYFIGVYVDFYDFWFFLNEREEIYPIAIRCTGQVFEFLDMEYGWYTYEFVGIIVCIND